MLAHENHSAPYADCHPLRGLSKIHPVKGLFSMAAKLSRAAAQRNATDLPLFTWARHGDPSKALAPAARHLQQVCGFTVHTARLYAGLAGLHVEDNP